MIGTSGGTMLQEVAACNTPMEEDLNEPLQDEIIEVFQGTINKLRAENEILREESIEAEENEAAEIRALRQEISGLRRANDDLAQENDDLLEQLDELNDQLSKKTKAQVIEKQDEIMPITPNLPDNAAAVPNPDQAAADAIADNIENLEALAAEDLEMRSKFKGLTGANIEDVTN